MEFVNFFNKKSERPKSALETLVLLLSPWHRTWPKSCGRAGTQGHWPTNRGQLSTSALEGRDDQIPVQINGKLRSQIAVAADADRSARSRGPG